MEFGFFLGATISQLLALASIVFLFLKTQKFMEEVIVYIKSKDVFEAKAALKEEPEKVTDLGPDPIEAMKKVQQRVYSTSK